MISRSLGAHTNPFTILGSDESSHSFYIHLTPECYPHTTPETPHHHCLRCIARRTASPSTLELQEQKNVVLGPNLKISTSKTER